jgi:hypothetical protein
MAATALTEFKAVLSDFRQLGSVALKGAVAAPLADLWLNLGPPPAKTVAVLTAFMEFVVVMWVFQFWRTTRERKLNVRMKTALVVFCLGLTVSLILSERFTVSPGPGRDRVLQGLVLRPDVAPLISSAYSPEDALRDQAYDPDRVWTRGSIVLARAVFTVIWVISFCSLAVYLTVFVMLQRRRQVPS